MKLIFYVLSSLWLFGCTVDSEFGDNQFQIDNTDPAYKAASELFASATCINCHAKGANLPNLDALITNQTLVAEITQTMPPANPAACVGECADALAMYLSKTYGHTPTDDGNENNDTTAPNGGNNPESPDNNPNTPDTNPNTPDNNPDSTPTPSAAQLFIDKGCQTCHVGGANFPDLTSHIQRSTLVSEIIYTMPQADPALCVADCAETLATYIEATFAIPNDGDSDTEVIWQHCANEKETCAFEGSSQVRYGVDDRWEILTATDAIECSNTQFTDPAPGSRKTCQVPNTVTLTADPTQPPAQTNAEQLFTDKGCANCHAGGTVLPNLTTLVEENRLANYIDEFMPNNAPDTCVDECAQSLANYLESIYYTPTDTSALQKEAVSVESYLRKAKVMLTGAVVTDNELQRVKADANALPEIIRSWQNTPGYDEKMRWFLEENLQFAREVGPNEYVGQLRGTSKANPPTKFVNPKIYQNGYESAIRTFHDLIVKQDKPFTNITTQTEFMMTPALMSLWLAFDYPNQAAKLDFKIGVTLSEAEKQYSLQQKIDTRRFYFTPPTGMTGFKNQSGGIDTLMTRKEVAFVWGALNQYSHQTSNAAHKLFKDSDYTQWKKVKIVQASGNNEPINFWDLPALRNTDTLVLNTERVGFFTHPNFFGRWETNDDNQWRVTINQTLITALNQSFAPDDLSITLDEGAISPEHAAPGTDCYGCHRVLDPMRNYFRNNFDDSYGKPRTAAEKTAIADGASFSFLGHTESGTRLISLGQALASHPKFASSWVQKLCYYTNAQNCIETDPEFQRVANRFSDDNFNLNELMVSFFSSTLVRFDVTERSERAQPAYGSISRQQHTCQLLKRRLSDYSGNDIDPCVTGRGDIKTLAANIPADDWTRGALAPATPTRPNMFSYTTMENICTGIAEYYYNTDAFKVAAIDTFLDSYLLPAVLGIPTSDSRRADIRNILKQHHSKLVDAGGLSQKQRLVSVFTLGCLSPLLSSVDF